MRADASEHAPQPADDDLRKDGLSQFYYSNLPTTTASQSLAASSFSTPSRMPAMTDNPANGNSNGNSPFDFSFELPVHTADLGRVPFHHGFSSHFDPRYSFSQPQQQSSLASQMLQQQPTFYSGLPQQHASIPMSLSNGGPSGEGMNGDVFGSLTSEMSLADYDQLLAAMSIPTAVPTGSNAQQALEQPTVMGAAGTMAADADVSMMFEDNMVEMWSSAPTSLA